MDGAAVVTGRRTATAAVLGAMAMVVLDAGMVGLALPSIAGALGETPARSIMIVTAYQAAVLMALLPCAHVAERVGYRRLFGIGVGVFGFASLLCALAPTLELLVAARFVQGLGGAAIMALGIALLRFALGAERLGVAIAWNASVVAICAAAAPAAGALLLSIGQWPLLFLLGAPASAAILFASRALPAVEPTSRSVDGLSMALYAAGAALLVVAAGRAPMLAAALAAGALLCLGWLAARERRKQAPLLPLDLLALRPFRLSFAASIFFFAGQTAGLIALPFHLQLGLGHSATAAGLVVTLWPVGVAAAGPLANRLAERVPALCTAGGALLAAGLAAAASVPAAAGILPLAACSLACGIGFGLFQVPNNRNLFLAVPAARSAAAGGMQGTARLAGQTAGALLVAWVLTAAPIALAPRLAFAAGAVAAVAAAWLSWRRDPASRGSRARHLSGRSATPS